MDDEELVREFFAAPHMPATSHEEWLLRVAAQLMEREARAVSLLEAQAAGGAHGPPDDAAAAAALSARPAARMLPRFGCIHHSVHGDAADVLERVLTTCQQMIDDRGCGPAARADDVTRAVEEGTPVVYGDGIDVYVHGEDKVGVKFARGVIEAQEQEGRDGHWSIIVSADGATPFTKRECEGKRVQFTRARPLC